MSTIESFAKFRTDLASPTPPLPPDACDCQVHVFGDPARYPPRPGCAYQPFADATIEAALSMHAVLGVNRGVIVQSTVHGTDHTILYDALATAGRDYRGVAIVTDAITDAELQRLHDAGVRGARFNFWKQLNIAPSPSEFRRSVARIKQFGWLAKIHASRDEWNELFPLLRDLDVPIVIDHFGHLDIRAGLDQPIAKAFLERLRAENWWIMVSNGDRYAADAKPWNDAASFIGGIAAAAPDRTIWSTDWPHVQYQKAMPTDAELVELLYRATPDPELRRKVLTANPAKLFDFN